MALRCNMLERSDVSAHLYRFAVMCSDQGWVSSFIGVHRRGSTASFPQRQMQGTQHMCQLYHRRHTDHLPIQWSRFRSALRASV
mgnify:CR=1 FL=1